MQEQVMADAKAVFLHGQRGVSVVAAVSVLFAAINVPASAQPPAYPTKPIRMLVGFPVGGGADVAARALGPRMSDSLGQQIIVDNRPGAGSAIASEITAKAAPDGYTLVSIGSSHAVNAALYPKLPFDPLKDVPTMMESGLADFDLAGAMGVFAPAATPKAALDRLSTEIMRAVQLPEVKDGMLRDGFAVSSMGPAEYDAFMRVKIQQIRNIAKAANIKAE